MNSGLRNTLVLLVEAGLAALEREYDALLAAVEAGEAQLRNDRRRQEAREAALYEQLRHAFANPSSSQSGRVTR